LRVVLPPTHEVSMSEEKKGPKGPPPDPSQLQLPLRITRSGRRREQKPVYDDEEDDRDALPTW